MQLALVTGASRGLGRALHQQLQSAGWQVIDFSRSAPHAGSRHVDLASLTASELPGLLESLPVDGVRELLIVHNAGVIGPIGAIGEGLPPTALLSNAHTNFGAPVLLLAALVRHYQALPTAKKWLFNISSGAAVRATAGWAAYCAAKAGMEHFIRCLAAEQETEVWPFLALNLSPGIMDTDMQADIRASRFPERPHFVKRFEDGALQDPAAVAQRIVALMQHQPTPEGGARIDVSR